MRVVTSCTGRFHIFDQAAQLHRHGLLHRLITATPVSIAKRWGIPPKKIDWLLANFWTVFGQRQIAGVLSSRFDSELWKFTHNTFSARLATRIPEGTDVLIGLSSLCYEAILEGKRRGIRTIVDHGSLHEASDREILLNESEKFGFRFSGNSSQSWLIEKEDAEFRAADLIFALSNVAKRTLVKNGIAPEKIFVNHGGVSLDQFYPRGKDDNVFRIIHCSNLTPRKGLHYLLQAFRELALPEAELWIIGPDHGIRGDMKFQSLVRKLSTPNVFFKGPVAQPQLSTYFSQGSVFVLPSLADGFGLVVLQAMACGLPVIVSDMTGAADLVRGGETGFIVPAGETEGLKEKLQVLFDHQELCGEMGRRARAMVALDKSWDQYGSRLAAFLSGLERP